MSVQPTTVTIHTPEGELFELPWCVVEQYRVPDNQRAPLDELFAAPGDVSSFSAATFALIAGRFQNTGGNYDNTQVPLPGDFLVLIRTDLA